MKLHPKIEVKFCQIKKIHKILEIFNLQVLLICNEMRLSPHLRLIYMNNDFSDGSHNPKLVQGIPIIGEPLDHSQQTI